MSAALNTTWKKMLKSNGESVSPCMTPCRIGTGKVFHSGVTIVMVDCEYMV